MARDTDVKKKSTKETKTKLRTQHLTPPLPTQRKASGHLVHGEGLDLSLEDAHAAGGDHGADVGHHAVAEDLVDEAVIAQVAGVGHVLHREPVVRIWGTGSL